VGVSTTYCRRQWSSRLGVVKKLSVRSLCVCFFCTWVLVVYQESAWTHKCLTQCVYQRYEEIYIAILRVLFKFERVNTCHDMAMFCIRYAYRDRGNRNGSIWAVLHPPASSRHVARGCSDAGNYINDHSLCVSLNAYMRWHALQ